MANGGNDYIASISLDTSGLDKAQKDVKDTTASVDKLNTAVKDTSNTLRVGFTRADTLSTDKFKSELDKLSKKFNDVSKASQDFMQNVDTNSKKGIESFLKNAPKLVDKLRDTAKEFSEFANNKGVQIFNVEQMKADKEKVAQQLDACTRLLSNSTRDLRKLFDERRRITISGLRSQLSTVRGNISSAEKELQAEGLRRLPSGNSQSDVAQRDASKQRYQAILERLNELEVTKNQIEDKIASIAAGGAITDYLTDSDRAIQSDLTQKIEEYKDLISSLREIDSALDNVKSQAVQPVSQMDDSVLQGLSKQAEQFVSDAAKVEEMIRNIERIRSGVDTGATGRTGGEFYGRDVEAEVRVFEERGKLSAALTQELNNSKQLAAELNAEFGTLANLGAMLKRELNISVSLQPVSRDAMDLGEALNQGTQGASRFRQAIDNFRARRMFGNNVEQAQSLKLRIEQLRSAMDILARAEVPTTEYVQLVADIQNVTREIEKYGVIKQRLADKGTREDSAAWQDICDKIETANQRLQMYNAQKDDMLVSGESHVSGEETEAYKKLGEEAEKAEAKLDKLSVKGVAAQAALSALGKILQGTSTLFIKFTTAGLKGLTSLTSKLGHGLVSGLKSFGKVINSITQKMNVFTKLSAAFGRIHKQLSRLIFLRLGWSFIAGVQNQFQASLGQLAKTSETFNKSISDLVNSTAALGASFVAAFQPLIDVVAPIITAVVDHISSAIDKFSQFNAVLMGQSTYYKVVKGNRDYADSFDDTAKKTNAAAKAVKDFKNTVMGFDELNKLSGTNDLQGTGPEFVEAMVEDNAFSEFAKKLRQDWQDANWEQLGTDIADGVNKFFRKVSTIAGWEANQGKIRGALNAFTTTVNSFVKSLSGEDIGKSIGDVLNTVVNVMDILFDPKTGVNFENIGDKLAQIFYNATGSLEKGTLGKAVVNFFQAIPRLISGALNSTFTDENGITMSLGTFIGNALGEFIDGADQAFDPDLFADLISGYINNIADAVIALFDNDTRLDKIGSTVGEALGKAFERIDGEKVGRALMLFWQSLAKLIKTVLTTQIETDSGEFKTVGQLLGRTLGDLLSGAITEFDPDTWGTVLAELVNSLCDVINEAFGDTDKASEAGTKLGETVNKAIEGIDADKLAGAISTLAVTLKNVVVSAIGAINVGDIIGKIWDVLTSDEMDLSAVLEVVIGWWLVKALSSGTLVSSLSGIISSLGSKLGSLLGGGMGTSIISALKTAGVWGLLGASAVYSYQTFTDDKLLEQTGNVAAARGHDVNWWTRSGQGIKAQWDVLVGNYSEIIKTSVGGNLYENLMKNSTNENTNALYKKWDAEFGETFSLARSAAISFRDTMQSDFIGDLNKDIGTNEEIMQAILLDFSKKVGNGEIDYTQYMDYFGDAVQQAEDGAIKWERAVAELRSSTSAGDNMFDTRGGYDEYYKRLYGAGTEKYLSDIAILDLDNQISKYKKISELAPTTSEVNPYVVQASTFAPTTSIANPYAVQDSVNVLSEEVKAYSNNVESLRSEIDTSATIQQATSTAAINMDGNVDSIQASAAYIPAISNMTNEIAGTLNERNQSGGGNTFSLLAPIVNKVYSADDRYLYTTTSKGHTKVNKQSNPRNR